MVYLATLRLIYRRNYYFSHVWLLLRGVKPGGLMLIWKCRMSFQQRKMEMLLLISVGNVHVGLLLLKKQQLAYLEKHVKHPGVPTTKCLRLKMGSFALIENKLPKSQPSMQPLLFAVSIQHSTTGLLELTTFIWDDLVAVH